MTNKIRRQELDNWRKNKNEKHGKKKEKKPHKNKKSPKTNKSEKEKSFRLHYKFCELEMED